MGDEKKRLVLRCIFCENYLGYGTCFAFRDEIPLDIFTGNNSHRTPTDKQGNDFVFKPIEQKKK